MASAFACVCVCCWCRDGVFTEQNVQAKVAGQKNETMKGLIDQEQDENSKTTQKEIATKIKQRTRHYAGDSAIGVISGWLLYLDN